MHEWEDNVDKKVHERTTVYTSELEIEKNKTAQVYIVCCNTNSTH